LTWRIAAASVVGSSHLDRALPCQDAHAYRVLADGTLLVAVADGAGSASRAEDGARLAVQAALAGLEAAVGEAAGEVSEVSWQARMTEVFRVTREALEEAAVEEWESLRAFACTLTCAVALPNCLVVGQVGDGVAVARAADGSLFAASQPQKGEYANEARFLTMPDALEHVDTRVFEQPFDALAVTTDGLLRLALQLPAHSPHTPFFTPLLAFAERAVDPERAASEIAAFLASPRICARTDDDKTLVIAVRVDPAASADPQAAQLSATPAPAPAPASP
jgi:serine/threonine protein phosphatase PrpC